MDRLVALRVFRSVVEHGSFAGAARALGLSKAAVSSNVARLERELGVRLITRTTRRLDVTEAGRLYHERAGALLTDLAEADAAVGELGDEPRGTLKVTAPVSLGLACLTPLVADFLTRFPAIELDLVLDDARLDIVGQGFDLAVRGHGPLPDSSLLSRRLMPLERVVCGSADYLVRRGEPTTPDELAAHECLLYTHTRRPEHWTLVRGEERRTVRVAGSYRVNNSLALRDAALDGAGLVSIPRVFVAEDLASARLRCVPGDWRPERQEVHALYPSGPFVPARTRAFVDFLVERLAATGGVPDRPSRGIGAAGSA